MGLDEILTRIRTDASDEALALRTRAHEQAEEIRKDGEKRAEEEFQTCLAAGIRDVNRKKEQARSQVMIQARRCVRQARESIISECFDTIAAECEEVRKSSRYPEILRELIREGCRILNTTQATLCVADADRQIAATIASSLKEEGFDIRISDEQEGTGAGVIIHSGRGVFVDNTFKARLDRYKNGLLPEIATILFDKD